MTRAYINNALETSRGCDTEGYMKREVRALRADVKTNQRAFPFRTETLVTTAFAIGKNEHVLVRLCLSMVCRPDLMPKWFASTKTRKKPESLSKASSMWWYSIIISRASSPLGSIDVFQYRLFASLKIYFQEIDFFVNKFGRNTVRTGSWQGS